ncbi:hypothetical protein NPIL_450651 [Nephila pilipes]|uniref:Uncharacterized protein n=1 Tax=Nephila pilipes TaxID=299642 RepID=A0A8X6NEH0_NEPPI|nr:hypothetical protein NPIL_450651 [Nephila pilipes]
MPCPGLSIQEALAPPEKLPSDTEFVLSDDSTDKEDYTPPQFPTETLPGNFDEEVSDEADDDIHLPGPLQPANVTWKKKNSL